MEGALLAVAVLGHLFFSMVSASERLWVQGQVVCQNCQEPLSGDGAIATSQKPLHGAFISLQCSDQAKQTFSFWVARTSKLGTFIIELERDAPLTLQCKARLLSSPSPLCNVKTNLNQGITGSIPIFNLTSRGIIAPLAFAPYYCHNQQKMGFSSAMLW